MMFALVSFIMTPCFRGDFSLRHKTFSQLRLMLLLIPSLGGKQKKTKRYLFKGFTWKIGSSLQGGPWIQFCQWGCNF